MAQKTVTFLGKEYAISDQIPILVPILRKFDQYKDELMKKLFDQIRENEYVGPVEQDFVRWSEPIRKIARDSIKYAAQMGVYDLTEYELVDKNPGYDKLHQVCKDTMHQMINALSEAVNEMIKGYDEAYAAAASNITGSGWSIWTSSLADAMLFSIMEGNVLKRQAKQADKQFNEALIRLSERNTDKQKQKEIKIKTEIYYPGCNESINIIISYMLDIFLRKLDDNKIFNCNEISQYDMRTSSEILKNINLVPQKAEVLGKAFEKCPYNTNIYASALDLLLFDDLSLDTVKYIKLENDFKVYVENKIGEVKGDEDIKKLASRQYYIHLDALMTGVSDEEYLRKITSVIKINVISQYSDLSKLINEGSEVDEFFSDLENPNDFEAYIEYAVKGIIDDDDFEFLANRCGHKTMLQDIIPDGYAGEQSKKEVDEYIVSIIIKKYRSRVISQWERKNEEFLKDREEKQKEFELNQKRIKKRKKFIGAIVGFSLCAVIAGGLIIVLYIIPENKYQNAVSLCDKQKYLEAEAEFEKLNGYKDSDEKIVECQYQQGILWFNGEQYETAIEQFKIIEDYKDSKSLISECERGIKYQEALIKIKNTDYSGAASIFKELGEYKDSTELNEKCKEMILRNKIKVALHYASDYMEVKLYNRAFEELEKVMDISEQFEDLSAEVQKKYYMLIEEAFGDTYRTGIEYIREEKYEEAINVLGKITKYFDAPAKINFCIDKIIKEVNSYLNEGEYLSAYEKLDCLMTLDDVVITEKNANELIELKDECTEYIYEEGLKAYESNDYLSAIEYFSKIQNANSEVQQLYKESNNQYAEELYNIKDYLLASEYYSEAGNDEMYDLAMQKNKKTEFSKAKKGDVIYLGGIGWIVLYVENNKIFVLTKKSQGNIAFDSGNRIYKDSSIRKYVQDIYNDQFSKFEKAIISENQIEPGETDYVFLPSASECEKYITQDILIKFFRDDNPGEIIFWTRDSNSVDDNIKGVSNKTCVIHYTGDKLYKQIGFEERNKTIESKYDSKGKKYNIDTYPAMWIDISM